jgi:polar amino acid transport system permease protein
MALETSSEPKLLPPKYPWRVVSAIVVLALLAALFISLAGNQNLQWHVVWNYLFDEAVLYGLANTLILTALCMAIGTVLGIVLAIMGMSGNPVLEWVARGYVWFFRGVPLIVQLVFWFNLALLWPRIGLIVPMLGIDYSLSTNFLITSFVASLLGLALHEAAYMAEIVRAGFLGVDNGQTEAARALGMKDGVLIRRIILPQAMRIIVPPTGNQVISLLKATSLVAFIAGGELMTAVQNVYAQNFRVIPLLLVATFWYLVVTTIASALQGHLERRVGQGFSSMARKPGKA